MGILCGIYGLVNEPLFRSREVQKPRPIALSISAQSMISSTTIQICLSALAATLTWPLIRHYLLPSPLDKIPGPKPLSPVLGELPLWMYEARTLLLTLFRYVGHLPQMFNPDSWDFHQSLVDNCESRMPHAS